jgi:hypothetical protein
MPITGREFFLLVHLGFAVVYLHAFAGGLAGLSLRELPLGRLGQRLERLSAGTWIMAAVAWLTVLSGTYIIFPWYRAEPTGGADLSAFPRAYLLADPRLAVWHNLGAEWKDHASWLSPILATAVAYVVVRYGPRLRQHAGLRKALIVLFTISFLSAFLGGLVGVMLNKIAPNVFLHM